MNEGRVHIDYRSTIFRKVSSVRCHETLRCEGMPKLRSAAHLRTDTEQDDRFNDDDGSRDLPE